MDHHKLEVRSNQRTGRSPRAPRLVAAIPGYTRGGASESRSCCTPHPVKHASTYIPLICLQLMDAASLVKVVHGDAATLAPPRTSRQQASCASSASRRPATVFHRSTIRHSMISCITHSPMPVTRCSNPSQHPPHTHTCSPGPPPIFRPASPDTSLTHMPATPHRCCTPTSPQCSTLARSSQHD